jgi:DNA-binding NarL/FixJ family response regulator
MFTKVIISDDLGIVNKGVYALLQDLGVIDITQVQYCDDAYLKIKRAVLDSQPYQLLITDLSFKIDHREQQFQSGEDLIRELRKRIPDIKIIVYSVEDRPLKLRKLIGGLEVEGFVNKGRNGLNELNEAILEVANGSSYVSPHFKNILQSQKSLEFDDFDALLIDLLAKGNSQEEIAAFFKENRITPSSLSSIEKRLNKLRTDFKANNVVHLVSIVKDLGLV